MLSGCLVLDDIYDFVRADPGCQSFQRGSRMRRAYRVLVDDLTSTIAEEQGVYVWGNYDPQGSWESTYVGVSVMGKTSHLRARINEDLKDWQGCFWRALLSSEQLLQKSIDFGWERYNGRDNSGHHRLMAKAGAHYGTSHVIWVSTEALSKSQIAYVKAAFMDVLKPTANIVQPVTVRGNRDLLTDAMAHITRQVDVHRTNRVILLAD